MNEFLIKLLGEEVLKQLVIILSADFEVLLSIYLFNIKGHYKNVLHPSHWTKEQ